MNIYNYIFGLELDMLDSSVPQVVNCPCSLIIALESKLWAIPWSIILIRFLYKFFMYTYMYIYVCIQKVFGKGTLLLEWGHIVINLSNIAWLWCCFLLLHVSLSKLQRHQLVIIFCSLKFSDPIINAALNNLSTSL